MSWISVFDSPLLLGFDHFERMLDRASKASAEGYPPYNIEQVGDNGLRSTLAVAGFSTGELDVSVEDNQLTVHGHRADDEADRVFLHRGIAARQFQPTFVLAEGIEIKGAALDNGLLNIDLERQAPETKVRTIKIENGGPGAKKPARRPRVIDVGDVD